MSRVSPNRALIAGLILACGLPAGCKVGPDYVAPTPVAPEHFSHTDAEGFATTSTLIADKAPELTWWESLRDPKLDELIERAVQGNLDLRLAAARIREARAQRGVVATDDLPQISLDGQYTRSRASKSSTQGLGGVPLTQNLFQLGFDASWELDVFGGNRRAIEAADAMIGSTIESRRGVILTLLSELAVNYVDLRGFQRRLDIARRNIDLQKQTVDLTKSRFDAGLTNEVDVAQARASLATTQSTVPTFDQGVHQSIHRIGVLLGEQPTALESELLTEATIPTVPDEIPVGIPSDLLRRRPDVRMAERDLASSTANIGVAVADLFPKFSLTGSFGHQSLHQQQFANATSRFWSFGPAMQWPIFQFGRVRANIAVADAQTDQALVRYQQAVLTSFEDVENAMVSFTREQDRRKSLQEAVDANQRAFDLSNQLYTNGLTDFLVVLDSQRALQASEDSLAESQTTVASNLISLYKALGGGWDVIEAREAAMAAPAPENNVTK